MEERRAMVLLLVRAFEETDEGGRLLPRHLRAEATRRALMVTGLGDAPSDLGSSLHIRNGEVVTRRARPLFESLLRRCPSLPLVLAAARLRVGIGRLTFFAALLLGVLANSLGPERRIDLLTTPVLGLLGWNLAVYVALALRALLRSRAGRQPRAGEALAPRRLSSVLAGRLLRLAISRRLSRLRPLRGNGRGEMALVSAALVRFGELWGRAAAPLLEARVRRLLHLASAAAVVGAVAGMYSRGIALQYTAVWESTLLGPAQVQGLLDVLLAPASLLLGIDVPDVAPLRGPGPGGDAAPWIHLFGLTALLGVVLPRTILGLHAGWRCHRLSHDLPVALDDPYYPRLFTRWRGSRRVIEVLPYGYRPRPPSLPALTVLLRDYFGARAEIRVREAVDYGGELPPPPWAAGSGGAGPEPSGGDDEPGEKRGCLVLLLNLAQTPEADVHAAFVERLTLELDPKRLQLLVCLDVGPFRQRVRSEARERERSEAWRRALRETGVTPVLLDPDRPADDAALSALAAALWPPAEPAPTRA